MKLVIGGYAQGKLDYVLSKYHLPKTQVWDGCWPQTRLPGEGPVVIDHFHQWVKKRIQDGGCPEEEVSALLETETEMYGDCIIICDEVGNGIVPADPLERDYRERVGRILIRLAQRAEEVERVICGIGQRIK